MPLETKMTETTVLLEAKGIDYKIIQPGGGENLVFSDISLSLKEGETLAILGPSGCGKTILMRVLMGLIPPTKGEIFYRGEKIDGLLPKIGVVFQGFSLLPWFTVFQN